MTDEGSNRLLMKRLHAATDPELQFIRKTIKVPGAAIIDDIADEYRSAGGNSIANAWRAVSGQRICAWRGEGASYHQILVDVADKLIPGPRWTRYTVENSTPAEVEDAVWHFAEERRRAFIAKLTDGERKKLLEKLNHDLAVAGLPSLPSAALGASAGAVAGVFAAAPMAIALFYHGFLWGLYASIIGPSTLALLGGGAAVATLVAVPVGVGFYAASPAYKKTVPATLAIVAVKKRIAAQSRLEEAEAV